MDGASESDAYKVDDLTGCRVVTAEGETLGTLQDVLPTGSNDIFVVSGEREYMIPALKTVVMKVDLAAREITVNLPAGLRDIYEAL